MTYTPDSLRALKELAEAASPGPWKACGTDRGGCKCGQVWSVPADCPVLTVERGEWGDHYPALRVTDDHRNSINGAMTIEAYEETLPYGALPDGQGEKNAVFVAAFNPKVCLDLLAANAALRDECQVLRQRLEVAEKAVRAADVVFSYVTADAESYCHYPWEAWKEAFAALASQPPESET